jgi:hypothetical protein
VSNAIALPGWRFAGGDGILRRHVSDEADRCSVKT